MCLYTSVLFCTWPKTRLAFKPKENLMKRKMGGRVSHEPTSEASWEEAEEEGCKD